MVLRSCSRIVMRPIGSRQRQRGDAGGGRRHANADPEVFYTSARSNQCRQGDRTQERLSRSGSRRRSCRALAQPGSPRHGRSTDGSSRRCRLMATPWCSPFVPGADGSLYPPASPASCGSPGAFKVTPTGGRRIRPVSSRIAYGPSNPTRRSRSTATFCASVTSTSRCAARWALITNWSSRRAAGFAHGPGRATCGSRGSPARLRRRPARAARAWRTSREA